MTLEQIKDGIKSLEGPELQELSALILRLKRSQDPERKARIASLLDSPDRKWVALDEVEKRLGKE